MTDIPEGAPSKVSIPGATDPIFCNPQDLDRELRRVFEKCGDCRRCLPLCPSFPTLFEALDRHLGNASDLESGEIRSVIDLCYQCKLCYNHCPYHPPHSWMLDFPRLMTRAKVVQARQDGIPLAEKLGARQDWMGRTSCRASALSNAAFRSRALRRLMEKATGIDRRWPMPHYERRPVSRWLAERLGEVRGREPTPAAEAQVLLFTTCFVEYSEARTAHALVQVLEHNGIAVGNGYEACCGAPFLHAGDLEHAKKSAARVVAALAPQVRAGAQIIVPGPTCSYQLKREFPDLLNTEEARLVSENTFDIGEFLWILKGRNRLSREFPKALGRVAYHLPCHLKSQNIGFRSRQLLRLAGAEVEMLDHCSGVDGTWGMKARHYAESQRVADRLIQSIEAADAATLASDCPLAAQRISERTGREVVHPIVLLRDAYGLEEIP